MEAFFDILKITIPAIIVFLTAYLLIKAFIKKEQERRKIDLHLGNQKIITPIKLQAYERITLLLERISPETMILRVNKPGMSSKDLQNALLATIRAEFEHNLSQQIYVSTKAWEVVKSARSNTVKLINLAAERVDANSPSLNLSKTILESAMEIPQTPTAMAINFLKEEINTVM